LPDCEKCGKKLDEDARFCSYCGSPSYTIPPLEEVSIVEPNKTFVIRRIVLALIIIVALSAVVFIVYQIRPWVFSPQPTQIVMGEHWSGYSVSSTLSNPQPLVTEVSGTWTVPSLTVTPGDAYSASWIGVGGQYDQTLIQTGTEHDVVNGQIVYSVWYELLPDFPIYLAMDVKPGDTISASVKLVDAVTSMWSISIHDVTNGQVFQKTVQYDSSMLSAEWVVERPMVRNRLSQLSDFGSVTFTNCYAIIGGQKGGVLSFPSSKLIINGRQNNPLVSVSEPLNDGSSFYIAFESAR
jgi:RNA polymerase subunit RPABC4/transcription elongation factor Spt4